MDSATVGRVFREVCESYPTMPPMARHFHRFTRTVGLVGGHVPRGGAVVDIGAWPGALTFCLKRLGWSVAAVDLATGRPTSWTRDQMIRSQASPDMNRNERSFAEVCYAEGVPHYEVNVEADPLPLESESVDAVLLTEVIEHLWHDPVKALCEINRVLKRTTGMLIVSTPNLLSLRNRLNFVRGRIDRVIENPFVVFLKARRLGHMGHLRLYAPKELEIMLHLLGFEVAFYFDRAEGPAPSVTVDGVGEIVEARLGKQRRIDRTVRALSGKLFRTPAGYARAIGATVMDGVETWIPRLRPQIFVVARKVRDADYERNMPGAIAHLTQVNDLRVKVSVTRIRVEPDTSWYSW